MVQEQSTVERTLKGELIRGALMILFLVAARLVGTLVFFIALFQFLCAVIVRKPNHNASRFGKALSCYKAEIIRYLCYDTERRPWPFSSWSQMTSDGPQTTEAQSR